MVSGVYPELSATGTNVARAGMVSGSHQYLPLAPALWSGVREELPGLSENHKPLLPDGRNVYQGEEKINHAGHRSHSGRKEFGLATSLYKHPSGRLCSF